MITRYITEIKTVFNPFIGQSKPARLFLSLLPGSTRASIKVDTKMLPKAARAKPSLLVTFKDGKVMDFDIGKLGIKGITEEVDRHSRILARQEDLSS